MKKIILTGGGTGGHVIPALALVPFLREKYHISYIGSKTGIERELVKNYPVFLPYYSISTGKLRRYFSVQNFTDAFRVIKGTKDAFGILRKIQPHIIFSKGGFVSVPVVVAAKMLKIPVILHESDISLGLANKISLPFVSKVCVTFEETLQEVENAVLTGLPIRESILTGNKKTGSELFNFKNDSPVILVMGGSKGSLKINTLIRESLNLLRDFNIIHITGESNTDNSLEKDNYFQIEFADYELPHIFAYADLVISRAGSNTLWELLALNKPNLLIPLSKNASRGDQIQNARSFAAKNYSLVIEEDNLSKEELYKNVETLFENRNFYIENMKNAPQKNPVKDIIKITDELVK